MARPRDRSSGPSEGRQTTAGGPLYLVRRLYEPGWDSIFCNSAAAWSYQGPLRPRWGGPVGAFASKERAEAARHARREALLERSNPFKVLDGGLTELSSLSPEAYRDGLAEAGLTPPPPGKDDASTWRRWWKSNRRGMDAEQRRRALDGLDRIRLYDVDELDPTPPGQGSGEGSPTLDVVSVELRTWKDDDDFLVDYEPGWMSSLDACHSPSGGILLATFRDRARAVSYRDDRQREIPKRSQSSCRDGFGVFEHAIPFDPRPG